MSLCAGGNHVPRPTGPAPRRSDPVARFPRLPHPGGLGLGLLPRRHGRLRRPAVPAVPIDQSNFAVGAMGLVTIAPLVVFGLYGGALADHVDRRKMLIGTGIAQAAHLCAAARQHAARPTRGSGSFMSAARLNAIAVITAAAEPGGAVPAGGEARGDARRGGADLADAADRPARRPRARRRPGRRRSGVDLGVRGRARRSGRRDPAVPAAAAVQDERAQYAAESARDRRRDRLRVPPPRPARHVRWSTWSACSWRCRSCCSRRSRPRC